MDEIIAKIKGYLKIINKNTETIEKAAEIYMKICDKAVVQSISNNNLKEIAEAFKINYRKGIID